MRTFGGNFFTNSRQSLFYETHPRSGWNYSILETPDFIPCIPTFRNEIKSDYKTASATFEKAFRQIEEHPDIAIGLANSSLESIIKK